MPDIVPIEIIPRLWAGGDTAVPEAEPEKGTGSLVRRDLGTEAAEPPAQDVERRAQIIVGWGRRRAGDGGGDLEVETARNRSHE